MATITLARRRCGTSACPGVHLHEESGTGYVVGPAAEFPPPGVLSGPEEAVLVLPADVIAQAVAARPVPGLVPFAAWPGVIVDAESGAAYVVGRPEHVVPEGVLAGPGEAVVAIPHVLAA